LAYENTEAKQFIRLSYDLILLKAWCNELGHLLSYFGLTGPKLFDVEDWRSVLAREITSVEEEPENESQVLSNASTLGVADGFQLILGKVEDVIVQGVGQKARIPQCHERDRHRTYFCYDLVNLDFDGGIGNTRNRVSAVHELISRQQRRSFMLFITLSPRSQQSNDLQYDIRALRKLAKDERYVTAIEWYDRKERGFEIYRLKAMVPLVVQDAARTHKFSCTTHVPVTYIGHKGARMIHFAFTLRIQAKGTRGTTELSDNDVLLLPLLESKDKTLRLTSKQVPGVLVDLVPSFVTLPA
jgi:hypothetical protein